MKRLSEPALLSLALALFGALLLFPRMAHAAGPSGVHVVSLDSDEASEDQAEALTEAIKSRVRNAPGFKLAETVQSLSMLLPALKCPAKPDTACLQRIGDQLKTDNFFWGTVTKAPTPHQVIADVHLWTRGKPGQEDRQTYSDNLKDQNDEALKRIAAGIFEKLTGVSTQGTVVVHSNVDGTLLSDGANVGVVTNGTATVTLIAGTHQLEVQAPGIPASPQSVTVTAGAQSEVTFQLGAATTTPTPPSKPLPIRKIVGFSTIGVGVALGVVGIVFGASYADASGKWDSDPYRSQVPSNVDVCSDAAKANPSYGPSATKACNIKGDAETQGTLAWVFGGLGVGVAAVGVVILATDHGSEPQPPPKAGSWHITPTFGPTGGGVSALLDF